MRVWLVRFTFFSSFFFLLLVLSFRVFAVCALACFVLFCTTKLNGGDPRYLGIFSFDTAREKRDLRQTKRIIEIKKNK